MIKANTPAAKRGRTREHRTKPSNIGCTVTVRIPITKNEQEMLKYLERERDMAPAEVLRLGLRYSGV